MHGMVNRSMKMRWISGRKRAKTTQKVAFSFFPDFIRSRFGDVS